MSRPTDWWVLDLDGDPTPGDSDRVGALGRRFLDFADVADRARAAVTSLQGDGTVLTWIGESGDAFREQFDDFPGQLRKVCDSHRMAGDALAAYAPELGVAQSQADKALADGRAARDRLTSLNAQLTAAITDYTDRSRNVTELQNPVQGAPAPDPEQVKQAVRDAQAAHDHQSAVQGQVDSANQALAAAKSLAEQARQMRDDAGDECARKIHEASHAGIPPRSFWQKLGDFLEAAWDGICKIAQWVALVAGVIALIIGGPLAWVAFGAGVILLVKAISDYAQGKGSPWEIALAAFGAIPGVKGLTSLAELSKLYKAGGFLAIGHAALTGLKNMVKGAVTALRDLAENVVTMAKTGINDLKKMFNDMPELTFKPTEDIPTCGDPIDVATGRMLMFQTDLELPGVLPLVLSRTHRSDYRAGRVFGRTWASTLDQRLEIEPDAVHFAAEDGMLLTYPVPRDDEPVLPALGAPLPLRRTPAGGYVLTDRRTGRTLNFGPEEDGAASLESIADRGGMTIRIVRDELGIPVEVRHDGGYVVAVDSEDELVTALRLLPGKDRGASGEVAEPVTVAEFRYDTDRRLVEVINSSGLPLRFDYDDDGRITRWEDRVGTWYSYTYDEAGRCVATDGRDGCLRYAFDYDPDNRITRVTDSLGHLRTFELDERLQVIAETDPLGSTIRSTWDACGRLLTRTDPLGNSTTYVYDLDGNLAETIYADNTRESTEYDERGLPVRRSDRDGATWRYEYTVTGEIAVVVDPCGVRRYFAFDGPSPGRPGAEWLGGLTVEEDVVGRPAAVTNAAGHTTRFEHDRFGRPCLVTDAHGEDTRYGWTPEGAPQWRITPDGATERWHRDAEGNVVERIAPGGGRWVTEYGPFDVPTAQIGPGGARTEFGYDTELRLTSVTNPVGLRWEREYDEVGRLVREVDFGGRELGHAYDAAGRRIETVNGAGEVTRYRYDDVGNLVEKCSGDEVTSFTYDACGRLLEARNADAVVQFDYDELGRVIAETINGETVRSWFDRQGRILRRETPSGAVSCWHHDAAGAPIRLEAGGHAIRFTHNAVGAETERRLDDGCVLVRTFDAVNRLSSLELTSSPAAGADGAPTTLVRREFTYRVGGALTGLEDDRTQTRRIELDSQERITAVIGVDGEAHERYAYDEAGNIAWAEWPGGESAAGTRTYRDGHVETAGQLRYRFDAQGRLITRSGPEGEWRYTWNAEDRLVAVHTPDGVTWRYRYDPLGRRIAKQCFAPGGASVSDPIVFAWSGHLLAEERHGDGSAVTWDHHPQTDQPVLQRERAAEDGVSERVLMMVTDLVGTPTELVDSSGRVTWRASAGVWGQVTDRGAPVGTSLRFPGQYHDGETGLHYNHFRYYDPQTGRYLSQDPLGLAAGLNPANYVVNPHTWLDPLGLMPCLASTRVDPTPLHLMGEEPRFLINLGKDWYRSIKLPDAGSEVRVLDTAANRTWQLDRFALRMATGVGDTHFSVRPGPFRWAQHDPLIFRIADGAAGGVRPYQALVREFASLADGGAGIARELREFSLGTRPFAQLTSDTAREFATITHFAESARGYSGAVQELPELLEHLSAMTPVEAAREWRDIANWFPPAARGDGAWLE